MKAITTEEKSINETFQIQSGLLTGIAATEKRFFAHADQKLTASMELEAAIRACGELPQQANLTRGKFATYSISAVILPLTSFNVTVSTPASFTLLKVTESPSSSTRLKS